jgi:hypothetical protein
LDELPAGSSLLFYSSDGLEGGKEGSSKQDMEQKQQDAADDLLNSGGAGGGGDVANNGRLLLAVDHMPEKLGDNTSMFAVKTVEGAVPVPDSEADADDKLLAAVWTQIDRQTDRQTIRQIAR